MDRMRIVQQALPSQPTLEGAGVHLRRAFGLGRGMNLDPFLLLDDFGSSRREDYIRGFPWHPHRGIETITYILAGTVAHSDSLGNSGVIGAGDVQWMTAGSGIIHQEMPEGDDDGLLQGFQLWANLPATHKMRDPRYREITISQIPVVQRASGTTIRIISGTVDGIQGPVRDVMIEPEYLDVTMPPRTTFQHTVSADNTAFAYVIEGEARFDARHSTIAEAQHLVTFGDGDQLDITSQDRGVRFLLISGRPLREPVAWAGPIVMNTQEELDLAFSEYRQGTFLKYQTKDS